MRGEPQVAAEEQKGYQDSVSFSPTGGAHGSVDSACSAEVDDSLLLMREVIASSPRYDLVTSLF